MKRDKDNTWIKGSFTVEACFLVTIILCVLIFLIYLTFFLYDRALVSGAAYQAAMESSRIYNKSKDDIKEIAEEKADNLLAGRLFACTYETSAEVSLTKVTVTYHVHMNVPFEQLMNRMLSWFSIDYSVQKSASKISGVTVIQTCNNLNRLKNSEKE